MSGGRIQEGGALLDYLRTQAGHQQKALDYIRRIAREGAPAQVLDAAIDVFALVTSMPGRQVRELVSRTEPLAE